MSYIETIAPGDAANEVQTMYRRQQAHFGYLPNYARIFSHRPDVLAGWAGLLSTIRRHVDPRRFELVTLTASLALRHSYCALAHGKALTTWHTPEEVQAIAEGEIPTTLTPADHAMMAYARKVARDAHSVSQDDISQLRIAGFDDAAIFDIAAVAAARAFFTKLLDSLGAEPDAAFRDLDAALRDALTVGRPIAGMEGGVATGQDERAHTTGAA